MNAAFFAKFRRVRVQEVRALRLVYQQLEVVCERRLSLPGLPLHELKAMTQVRAQMRDAILAADRWLADASARCLEPASLVGHLGYCVAGDYGRRETETGNSSERSASAQEHLIGPRDPRRKRSPCPNRRRDEVRS